MKSTRSALLPLTAALLSALLATSAALGDGDRGDPGPGAPGIGDPYFPDDGNGGYDVEHYDLRVRYDPDTDVLRGRATIRAEATEDLESFNLDLQGLEVGSVVVNGRRAGWEREGSELTVHPRRWLREDRSFTVVIRYGGVPELTDPNLGISGFMHTDDGALVAGQPHVAAAWFPVNDHPIDKASYTFRVTVPEGLEAVANGVLKDKRTRHGWSTWTWRAREPMAPYLTVLAIGEFDLRSYRADGLRYWDAVDPDLYAKAGPQTGEAATVSRPAEMSPSPVGPVIDLAFGRQPEITDWLGELFGPYPFRTSGGIVDDHDLGFALETQTRSVYDPAFFSNEVDGYSVVVHELAHQWVGNLVTLERWQHIWLHEGFATYTEWLWAEEEGQATAEEIFDLVALIPADDPFWRVTIGDPGPDDLFHLAVYERGAATLHALRTEVGDEAFFAILRTWVDAHRGGHVATEDFVAHAEQVSGEDLEELFDAWLFSPTKPGGLPEPSPVPPEQLPEAVTRTDDGARVPVLP